MKFLLAFCSICIVITYCHDGHIHFKMEEITAPNPDVEECAQKNRIDKTLLSDMKKNKIFTQTQEMQGFATCLLKKSGIMRDDGTINKLFTESPLAPECKNMVGKDECEIAAKILECLTQNNIVLFAKE